MCFNGPEKELPQGDTTYGTSLLLEKAMYDGNDILVGGLGQGLGHECGGGCGRHDGGRAGTCKWGLQHFEASNQTPRTAMMQWNTSLDHDASGTPPSTTTPVEHLPRPRRQ